jgi:hypothetical protein
MKGVSKRKGGWMEITAWNDSEREIFVIGRAVRKESFPTHWHDACKKVLGKFKEPIASLNRDRS